MDIEKMEKMSCGELVDLLIDDYGYCSIVKDKHEKELEERSIQLAKTMEEERFNAHKEEFQLEVLQQLQAEGIKKEGMELSSASPLISDTYIVDGVTLLSDDYITDSVETDSLYEETSLIKSPYSLEYQEVNHKTGKRKLAWKESAMLRCTVFEGATMPSVEDGALSS